MENFVVSARKYRPATFDTVVGQQSITSTLKNAIKTGHLAQAFLFCGPRGVGKTTCARILAKTINCFNRTETIEACDKCESCNSFNEGQSLNVHELDAASNNSVDDIRNLVDQVRFAPQLGSHKVYIIDEVHMLSNAAFNAFLKTLEEPPKHAIFILATTEKHKIIPTILSRCQIFDFNRIQIEDIAHHLAGIAEKEKIKAEEDALHIIAQKADGALRDALSMFDQIVSFSGNNMTYEHVIENLNILDYDYYFKVTDLLITNKIPETLMVYNEILNKGFDGHNFIVGLGEHLRNLLVSKDEITIKLLEVGANIKEKYLTQSKAADGQFLLKALSLCNQADLQFKGAKNQRLLIELCLMQLCSITNGGLGTTVEKKNDGFKVAANIKPGSKKVELVDNQSEVPKKTIEAPKTQESVAPVAATTPPQEKQAPQAPPPQVTSQPRTTASGKRRIPSVSASLGDMLNEKPKAEVNNQSEDSANSTPLMSEEYSNEDLMKAWNELMDQFETEGKEGSSLVTSAMRERAPVREGNQVNMLVENKSQEQEVLVFRPDMHDILRSKLKNSAITIEVTINRDMTERKAYTDAEKFQKMIERNPSLLTLKQKLDLDFI
jgi:DNA polymerase-3 subunit gamma/tau